jgi:hypothetical protein
MEGSGHGLFGNEAPGGEAGFLHSRLRRAAPATERYYDGGSLAPEGK